jgi:hypothetical protein
LKAKPEILKFKKQEVSGTTVHFNIDPLWTMAGDCGDTAPTMKDECGVASA